MCFAVPKFVEKDVNAAAHRGLRATVPYLQAPDLDMLHVVQPHRVFHLAGAVDERLRSRAVGIEHDGRALGARAPRCKLALPGRPSLEQNAVTGAECFRVHLRQRLPWGIFGRACVRIPALP